MEQNTRVLLKHLSGSRKGEPQDFPLGSFSEIVIGRDPSSHVKFDPDKDDLVSRQHAKIVQDAADPASFTITDLNSKHGTFVNKSGSRQRIHDHMRINPGDVIQFGPGGPELLFDLDPRPAGYVPPTREVDSSFANGAVPPTRETDSAKDAGSRKVSKDTVERIVARSLKEAKSELEENVAKTKSESRSYVLYGGAALLALIALITGLLIYQNRTTGGDLIAQTTAINEGLSSARREAASSASPNWKAITEQYQSAVVQIEVGWHIVDTASKGTLYHRMVRNRDRNGKPLIPIKREYLPGFVKLIVGSQSFIEPFTEPNLKSEQGENASDNIPIGGKHQGSGFVADPNGFILTNKHVAATWEMKYQWPDIKEYQAGGILLVYQKNPVTEKLEQAGGPMYLRPEEFPTDWIPANSRLRGGKLFSGKNVDGEFDYLEVVFAGDRLRRRARLILPSDRHDVALIKVDVTQPLNHVQMRLVERDGEVKKQEPVLVMGYPSVTPEGIQVTASAQGFGNNSSAASVPDPTATSGAIQNLPRDKVSSEQTIFSEIGDAYQLDINATGSGNSGGPVFDDKGRVIGIFYAGRASGGAVVSFALPISYGLDLMGPKTATSK